MTTFYVDTSVAIRALLGHSTHAAAWFDAISADPAHEIVSSRILRTELTRVLRREGLPVRRREELLDVVALFDITDGVLAAAEAIEPHLKTLDAIHLGTVIVAGADLTIVTHDTMMKSVANTLGYPVHDPVQD